MRRDWNAASALLVPLRRAHKKTDLLAPSASASPPYRQLAELTTVKELNELIQIWRDRFGRPPEEVDTLLRCTELKLQAYRAGCSSLEIKDHKLMLMRRGDYILLNGKFPRLREKSPPRERLLEAVDLVRQL